jgi:serine/threonine protein kinase
MAASLACGAWDELRQRAQELAQVLAEVHRCDMVHGDVKESNLCARQGEGLRLIDWESGVRAGEVPGRPTDGYRAPETRGEQAVFCAKSDVFSAGVVIRSWLDELPADDEEMQDEWRRVVEHMTLASVDVRWDAEQALQHMRDVATEDNDDTKDEEA